MDAALPFEVTPLAPGFGARITGVRLATIDDAAFTALYRTWLDHGLLICPGQFLSKDQQVAVAARFGPLEFKLIPISNVRDDGRLREPDDAWVRVLKGNQGWHTDSTYVAVQSKGALLSAHIAAPEGGATEWADTAGAYDALPADLKARIEGLSAFHSMRRSQALAGDDYQRGDEHGGYGAEAEPPLRPLVKVHPETGRRALTIGRHAYGVPGLTEPESEALLAELLAMACRPEHVCAHRWRPGDVAIWDNRRTMHRGQPWDLARPRVLYHTRIAGDPVSEFAGPGERGA
jgi:alpha-ketoglutarate-dependent taurine dioxygenase